MGQYYLAVDIGASSGRHMLGWLSSDGRMQMEEIHRFPNGLCEREGEVCWDLAQLFQEIITGLKKCRELGKIPVSMGIDTWGVDFVLLNSDGHVIGNPVSYRDRRTEGMDEILYRTIPEAELYARTGIQKLIFNTIYQLIALREKKPAHLAEADSLLLIPDYFHYLLTGRQGNEYTNATTTQLINPATGDWDWELIEKLSLPKNIFRPVLPAGTVLGHFSAAIREDVGFDCQVVLPATHDTGSAVLAVPAESEPAMYLSSGTWSLMGVEREKADCSAESRARNFTNEGGYQYRFRYLKNIMGLWMVQGLQKELREQKNAAGEDYSFAGLCESARKAAIPSLVDCNDDAFLAPASMIEAVREYCRQSGQPVPESAGELAAVIYRSLADCYGKTAAELEEITGVTYPALHIVGGGANAAYLNELTAQATGKKILAGPVEATAIGNLTVQMLTAGKFTDIEEARSCIRQSFEITSWGL